jgi:hypothetical protein
VPSRPSPRLALALLALLAGATLPAHAADLDEGWDGPSRPPAYGFDRGPPPPPPAYEPPPRRFVAVPPPPPCRVIVRRHLDPYGDEVVRRVRICDEPIGRFGPPDRFGPPPWHRSW